MSRALSGNAISTETLRWIIGAFDIDRSDADHLWATYTAEQGFTSGITHTLRRRREMVRRQRHRTVSLVERYFVDETGSLQLRSTFHTIRAIEDGVDLYIFNHEPQASEIEVLHGGMLGTRHVYGGGLIGQEIIFTRPLTRSQTTALEYRTHFAAAKSFTNEVRRAAFARTEHVDLAVKFPVDRIPRHVWWCVWDDHLGGAAIRQDPMTLQNGTARYYVPFIEETSVGFTWEW
ncbi:hypothetical protein GKQ77_03445 [Streptomyces sp. BG9H]|uniref:Uncharacterized protein n=1 Tax=Streptomyces anatolicus TaxID=2675858 RepID=A0ABS6YGV0_9ACTN|nr:hypothetical protein [Streptomyces anatolicus]MBW5420625.1 hypothetical protein [Streptomyces anatolicus]